MAGILDRVAGALRRVLGRLAGGKRAPADNQTGQAGVRPTGGGKAGAAAEKRAAGAKRAAGGARKKKR